MVKKIYLVRHCQAKGQSPNASLTPLGFEQSKELSGFLLQKEVDMIISSPYLRAVDSIKPFAEKVNVQIKEDKRLSERVLSSVNHPDWLQMLKESFTDLDLRYEGGESSDEAMSRAIKVITDVINSPFKTTVLVTHGNLMALILKYFDSSFGFEEWRALSNPDVYCLTFTGEEAELERVWK
ncbi:histidine phosphatase family protein [Bacillus spongiae]|uniref:Histidine phosphatase family protein n=1 Tax=Bacillus spongiae TaxID=2683610 RepID=A0ABU8HHU4_9BACI